MKEKIVSVFVIVILLSSALGAAFTTRLGVAHSLTPQSLVSRTVTPAGIPDQKISEGGVAWSNFLSGRLGGEPSKSDMRWDFHDSGIWGNATFTGGNRPRIIVGVKGDSGELKRLMPEYNAKLVSAISADGLVIAFVIELPFSSVPAFTDRARTFEFVRYVEPDLKVQAFLEPNDPYWSLQWGPKKIAADWAWNATTGSHGVLVAVLDTGIDYAHPDLAANYQSGGLNWAYNNSDPRDDFGHGTHCAGIIAASINNSLGVAGLAQVRIMAEKVLDSGGGGNWEWLAQGIIHATDQGARVISMSLGGGEDSGLVHDAVRYAYSHGVLLVAAAGNSASRVKSYPAAYDEVVAVAAIDEYDNPAAFSNWGEWIELAAPGVDIYSTMPTYHVTMNDYGFSQNYASMSGTSMACPHVSGVAALVLTKYSNMSVEHLRMHLRYTVDDLGDPGFDLHYGYGRLNARSALEMVNPQHELIVVGLTKQSYVEPNATATMVTKVLNYGSSDEANITVQLWANRTLVNSTTLSLVSWAVANVSESWTPAIIGNYNVTVYVVPVENETNRLNNRAGGYIYVGYPVKAVVLDSAGTRYYTEPWDILNENWYAYGNKLVSIDYTTLSKQGITYEDLNATGADVLIISCAFMREYTDAEIDAITQYVYEGHGLVVTAGTFYHYVPNNNKLAALFGINESISWTAAGTDMMEIANTSHPVFSKIPNPYVLGAESTSAVPPDGTWDQNDLTDGKYLALGYADSSAIVEKDGLVYISPWLEALPARFYYNFQLLYNAITWSHYPKPQHNLAVSLRTQQFLLPEDNTTIVNATVVNRGLDSEANVTVRLYIDGAQVKNATAPFLPSSVSFQINYTWNSISLGVHNVTVYAAPVSGEMRTGDNKAVKMVTKTYPLIRPQEGQWARYKEEISTPYYAVYRGTFSYNHYVSRYQMNVSLHTEIQQPGSNSTQFAWFIVNIMNRIVEKGDQIGLTGYYYPGWIETNVTVGSYINFLDSVAIVVGSEVVAVGVRSVECWTLEYYPQYGGPVTYLYDKRTGLWIGGRTESQPPSSIMLEDTNISVGMIREHDLGVLLEAPSSLWLGNTSLLKATVSNCGTRDEANVTMELLINGSVVNSLSEPLLAVNYSRTINFTWIPTETGAFNITVYAHPVPNEATLVNNVAEAMVGVRAFRGLVLFDQMHSSDSIYNYEDWVQTLEDNGYIVDTFANGTLTFQMLEKYDVFVVPQPRSAFSVAELSAINRFVSELGRGLLVLGGNSPSICTTLTRSAGVTWAAYSGIIEITRNVSVHPVTSGVSGVYLYSPLVELLINGSARSLVWDSASKIMLAVSFEGSGRVLSFSTAWSFADWSILTSDNLLLATNAVHWLSQKETSLPSVTITSPLNGTLIGSTEVSVQWTGSDNESGIGCYLVYLNGDMVANTSLSHAVVSDLAYGPNSITVVAYDFARNNASDTTTIIVDTTPPSISVLSPSNQSFTRATVSVNFTCDDEHFAFAELSIDGTLIANYTVAGNYVYVWNTTAYANGSHTLVLIAEDVVGNAMQSRIDVMVDNTLPSGDIIQPANNSCVRALCNTSITGFDANLDRISLYVNQDLKQTWLSPGFYTYVWNTTTVQDGAYTIRLRVQDRAGNLFERVISVVVDNTKPQATILSPVSSSMLNGTVTINFTATDSNLAKVTLYVDNATFDVTGYTSYGWNTANVGDGTHLIRIVALDRAGNVGEAQVTISTTNIQDSYISYIAQLVNRVSELESWIKQLEYLIAGIIVATTVAALLAYAFLKKKQKTVPKP